MLRDSVERRETIKDYAPDVGTALGSKNADYVRTLLKLLYLLLEATSAIISNRERWDQKKDESDISLAIEILDKVTSQSFRSLIKILHDDPSKVLPADFALINALLRRCLSFPGLERHPQALYAIFVDNKTVHIASTLLSWSDQLAIDGDPIYGEISTDYLVELSKIPILAESIMVDGVLSEILTVRLFQLFRRSGGIGPFEAPARMHSIWVLGVLPLLINILGAVGAPAAVEVATFLNLFTPQLERASSSFDLSAPAARSAKPGAGCITLAQVSEVQSLALLTTVLDRSREAGASAGVVAADVVALPWDAAAVRLDLENLLQRPNTLQDRLVPLGEREKAWAREKPTNTDSGAKSKYEETVITDMRVTLSLLGSD